MKILICVKGISERCPNKNMILLPYTLEYCKDYDYTVITDDASIVPTYAKDVYVEKRVEGQSELDSCLKYATENGLDRFILLPVTHPLRDDDLIERVIDADSDDIDFVTSYNIVAERSIFYIDNENHFINETDGKCGRMCKEYRMINGAIYLIHTDFLKNTYGSNKLFWGGNFKAVENKSIFLDIDTNLDLNNFLKIKA